MTKKMPTFILAGTIQPRIFEYGVFTGSLDQLTREFVPEILNLDDDASFAQFVDFWRISLHNCGNEIWVTDVFAGVDLCRRMVQFGIQSPIIVDITSINHLREFALCGVRLGSSSIIGFVYATNQLAASVVSLRDPNRLVALMSREQH